MRIILLTIFILAGQSVVASGTFYKVMIEDEIEIIVKKYISNRSLPHSFYDQAVSSIPKLYPENVLYAKRRYGHLGKMVYSIVCYKENKNVDTVLITGTAVIEDNAWSFETRVPQSTFGDRLLIVLEAVEKLPSNKSLKQGTAQSAAP